MPSSFASTDLFSSGPHRFSFGPAGEQLLLRAALDPYSAGSQGIGQADTPITVRGRLIADDDASLWTLIDAITAMLTHDPTIGDLIDDHGRTFKDAAFISFHSADRIDRGHKTSLAYEARFLKYGGGV